MFDEGRVGWTNDKEIRGWLVEGGEIESVVIQHKKMDGWDWVYVVGGLLFQVKHHASDTVCFPRRQNWQLGPFFLSFLIF